MKTNDAAHNALWLILGKLARMAVDLAVSLLTARYLGPANYGLLSYGAAYTGFFASLCTLGLNAILVKALMDDPEKEGEILGTSLFLQGLSGLLSAIAIACIVYVADAGDLLVVAVVCLSSLGMVLQSFEVFHCWFQWRMQSGVTAMVLLAAHVVAAGYKVVLFQLGKTVVWFAGAAAVEQLCMAALLWMAYRRHRGSRLHISREMGWKLLQKSRHFILPGMMVAVYAQTDKMMLKRILGQSELGYYSMAVSLCNVWCFVLSAIIDAMYPEIAKLHRTAPREFCRRNRQLYAIVFYLSTLVSALLFCLAEPVISLLYGTPYLPAAEPLRILTWYTGLSYLGVARNAWVVCKNRQKHLIWVYAAGAVSNVALNLLWIPAWGSAGAAAASLAAQIITTVIAPFGIKELRENAMLMLDAILLKDVFQKRRNRDERDAADGRGT